VAVIEDCAQSHGATVDGHPVGAFGDFAASAFRDPGKSYEAV
jgi:dTDP-4-amino-4,6-dideoxygalactose transaminase